MRTHAIAWWLGIGLICLFNSSTSVAGQDGPRLETLDQYTRLQIPVTSGSSFRLLTGSAGEVQIVIERVATGALERLSSFSDKRVRQVSVKPLGLDKAEVSVRFHDSGTESFAYQQGNVLVLDLWRSTGSDARQESAQPNPPVKQSKQSGPRTEKTQASTQPKMSRIPAGSTKASPSKKPESLVRVDPLNRGKDLFQKFVLPMPELLVKAKDGGIDLPPNFQLDEVWTFTKGDKSTEDGRAFEFAKSLYKKKKYGLCLKTIEIFSQQYPNTEYSDESELLRAMAYQKLAEITKEDALEARGEKILEALAARRDEDGNPLSFTHLIEFYFAKNELKNQNWLRAIQHLEYVSKDTKASDPEFPYVQMLLAESYGKLKQNRRAERLYRFITEKFPKHILAKEAYFRIANLLAQEGNHVRVAEEGEAAISTYPEYEKTRSEVVFQIAEAYFWLGQYEKAEKNFKRFIQISSAQTNASLAWVRLGEIQELHRSDLAKAKESYLRAKNGYPFSPGDLAATVRLARINLPNEKEPAFVVHTLRDLLADSKADVDLKRMAELTLADYLILVGEVNSAISLAKMGMAESDGPVYELYKKLYERGLFLRLKKNTEEKKYSEALAMYERDKRWLESYGPETYRVMAALHQELGLYSSASQFTERYEAEIKKAGRLPSSLALVKGLNREKAANSFARGDYSQTLDLLEDQRDESTEYLRVISLYRLGRKQESYALAEPLIDKISSANPRYTDDMIENVAEIVIERDDLQRDYVRMASHVAKLRSLFEKDNDRLAFASADALWYQKRHSEAEKAYKDAIEKFPNSIRLDRAKFNLGMSLLSQSKRDEAVKLLTALRDSGQGVWSESAKQELELIEWEKKYSSVLKTLPPAGLGIKN